MDNTGVEKYLYIRYSHDGQTFTENNGLTPGEWLGTCTTNSSVAPTNFNAYQWSKIKGEDGADGIPGANGEDGKTTYFHVKYSDVENPTEEQMTEAPSKYIGTYVDYIEEDSTNPEDYKWIKFIGEDGIPGENGVDGKTYYLHIKYSNDNGNTFTDNNGENPGEYLGVYTDTVEEDSMDVTKYTWSLIKGQDATTYYTWIKYADDANGTNMSDDPTDKAYIGIAYNKESSKESVIASDYIWSLIKGANGIDGDNGVTYYTWIKYADDDIGTGISDDPTGKEYIGISYNNIDSNESDNPKDYTWSLFKGEDGIDGKTGVAGKGIKSITEYYLISQYNTGIDRDNPDWSTDIPTLDSIKKYLWNYEETIFVIEEFDASGNIIKSEEVDESEPIVIGVYGESGSSLQIKYISSATTPVITNNNVDAWLDVMPAPVTGQKIYMIQKLSDEINWSTPIQISAEDGATPKISIVNGYWNINGESTGVKAEGENGDTPEITIGQNGNWFINGSDSGTKAQGETGKDGSDIEFVYYRSEDDVTLSPPQYTNGVLTSGWAESPQGITELYKYEYVSVRNKPVGGSWSEFSAPVVWSKWGEKGQDGDGIEYRYYLSNTDSIPTYSSGDINWTDDPQGVSSEKPYEYVVQIKIVNGEYIPSLPSLWAKYSKDGESGAGLQIKYISSETNPTITNNDVSGWLDNMPAPADGKKIYMTQKLSTDVNWSSPIQISATDGKDGSASIEINDDGYWVINGEITDVLAKGADGKDPKIEINDDGYWVINDSPSNIKAQGEAGKDGADIEYVYYRSQNEVTLSAPSYTDGVLTSGWTASPQGITDTYKYEYISVRNKPSGGSWSTFSTPVIWSKWGDKGQDGDGVEYKYYLSNSSDKPTYSVSDNKWTDDPTGVSLDNQYEYVVQIKTANNSQNVSDPSLWAKYGEDGNGIVSIKNYYNVTSEPTPPSTWEITPPAMTVTNKYLWNYEEIVYTNDTIKTTDPAIIGIRGDNGTDGANGTDAVDFQIYSIDGFEFSIDLTSIKLKTVAFQGGNIINSGATYQWKWWNPDSLLDDKYEAIEGATTSELDVNIFHDHAFSNIKCEMYYGGLRYEDCVSLTQKTTVYTSVVKFFSGSNLLGANEQYLIAYIELYKDNEKEETIITEQKEWREISYESITADGIIQNVSGNFSEGDMMYFVYKKDEDSYNIVLGEYSNQWRLSTNKNKYTYTNDFVDTDSNVFVIPKKKISRTLDINIEVYKTIKDENEDPVDRIVSRTNITVMDLNDPVVGGEPAEAVRKKGMLWLDTLSSPSILKMWDGEKWVNSGYQHGGAVYTSRPNEYTEGDLWILADGETFKGFGPGSMFKATQDSSSFVESHWVDATGGASAIITNVSESFTWDNNGIKIAKTIEDSQGNVTTPFYVHLDSTRMGFHSVNNDGVDSEVVHIGYNSAVIKNATFVDDNANPEEYSKYSDTEGARFDCNATFDKQISICKVDTATDKTVISFVWKVEDDKSLSLSIVKPEDVI